MQKDLVDYAPPVISSHLTHSATDKDIGPANQLAWWSYSHHDAELLSDSKALVRVKSLVEELASLDTPKANNDVVHKVCIV